MPFQPFNYANIAPQGSPWMRDLVENLTTGYQASQVPRSIALEQQKNQLANQMSQMLNQEQPEKFKSDMATAALQQAFTQANTNKLNTMTPLEAQAEVLKNQFYPELTKSQIASNLAMANLRNMGGSGLGTGGKEEIMFQNLIKKDNPNLNSDQVYEASNILRSGGNTLSDGTKLNPMSPAAQASFDRLTKYGTTAGAITPLLKARQADAELKTLMSMSQPDFAPYATTFAGYSPEQIADTFKSDDASQTRLGKFMAAQAAQYEAAQIRNRIAGGEPGLLATQELMGKSGQIIKTLYPKLSAQARQAAANRLDEYLSSALQARQSVGIGASSTLPTAAPVQGFAQITSTPSGVTRVYFNGKSHLVPNDKLKDALNAGGTLNG